MIKISDNFIWLIFKEKDPTKDQLFFEIKIFKFFPLFFKIKSFPPVKKNNILAQSYYKWKKKIENYPIRSSTLLTSIKEGSDRRIKHPFS